MKSRFPVFWSFTSCDENVAIHAVCVNNVVSPKIKAFSMLFSCGKI